ncbi:MAG: marine proteobacterial sortase target protein [Pseudomonadota bacterium]
MQHRLDRCKALARTLLLTLILTLGAAANAAPGQLTLRLAADGSQVDAIRLATQFDVTVSGHVARTVVTQTFRNATSEWAEAIYQLPLPDDAAVDHLTLKIGERLIMGEIQRREEALATYRAARDAGQKTALLEQQRANLFTTGIANIAPGETIAIELEYQQVVARDGARSMLRIPLTMTPRYIPGNAMASGAAPDRLGSRWSGATDQVADGHALLISQTADVPSDSHRVQLFVTIDAGLPLAFVQSRYHRIDVDVLPDQVHAVALANETVLDHDFELEWQPVVEQAPLAAAFAHQSGTADYLSVQVMPPAQINRYAPPRTLTLVIDTSGSMQGTSIEQARTAATFAVRNLRDVDTFNVIEFNTTTRALFPQPVPATPVNVDRATHWIGSLVANGGTEMASALKQAIAQQENAPGELSQIVFVTDGAVGNEAALFRQIEQGIGQARLFTVGIGAAPNGWFMRKAAEVGRGTATMISALHEVNERMQSMLADLGQPVLTDIEVDWGRDDVQQYPVTVPDLYAGEPIDLAVRAGTTGEPLKATLRATLWRDGQPQPWQTTVQATTPIDYPGVGVLWARARIESIDATLRQGQITQSAADDAIAAVALGHHLVSRMTSLVAVDHTPARVQEALRRQRVANLAAHGQRVQPLAHMTSTATPALQRLLTGIACLLMVFGAWAWQRFLAVPEMD